jgi:hypothetical protein
MSAFVGRVDELAALDAVARAAGGGEVGAAVVVGDAGSGKSRLLAEAADRIDLARVFRVIGYEPERRVPLAAASDLLRALADTPVGRQLGVLLFDPTGESSTLEPMRVFEAAHSTLRVIGPALVVMDRAAACRRKIAISWRRTRISSSFERRGRPSSHTSRNRFRTTR